MNGNPFVCYGLPAEGCRKRRHEFAHCPSLLSGGGDSNVENAISFRPAEESTYLVKTATEVVKASKCRK